MRIDETPGAPQQTPAVQRSTPDAQRAGVPASNPRISDGPDGDIEVSDRAKLILRARQIARAETDIRQERVDEIRRQIQSGSYRVDSGQVARRTLEDLGALP